MTYVVRILTPADTDAVEAALWYDSQSYGLGAEFLREVNATALRLTQNPEIYGVRFADVRRAPIRRFKYYGLYYLIREKEVWVISVFHGRRHPRWLLERRKQVG